MEIFKLVMADKDKAVIEVMVDNPLTVALHPYVKATYKYITVTRGKNHIMTVVRPDGDSFSFSFGENGHTLISDNLVMLRTKVMEFLDNSGIMMEAKCNRR